MLCFVQCSPSHFNQARSGDVCSGRTADFILSSFLEWDRRSHARIYDSENSLRLVHLELFIGHIFFFFFVTLLLWNSEIKIFICNDKQHCMNLLIINRFILNFTFVGNKTLRAIQCKWLYSVDRSNVSAEEHVDSSRLVCGTYCWRRYGERSNRFVNRLLCSVCNLCIYNSVTNLIHDIYFVESLLAQHLK